RDLIVTGVQTCALPISKTVEVTPFPLAQLRGTLVELFRGPAEVVPRQLPVRQGDAMEVGVPPLALEGLLQVLIGTPDEQGTDCRSEERRVGKECRSWLS